MVPQQGLHSDTSETQQPPNTYRFAKNIIDSNVLGAKENEDGFTSLGLLAPYTVIGTIAVGEEIVVFSTNNTNSEIGVIKKVGNIATYTAVYNNTALNFSTTKPIHGEWRKDVTNSRVIAWTDNSNPPRILNIDNLSGVNDINDLLIFQEVNNPAISSSGINDTGGALSTGAIVPITKYRNKDGSETNWFVHDHTFYINDDSKSIAFENNDGAPPGTKSNKSITFTLTGLDTRFDTLVVGYIQTVNNITTAYQAFTTTNASTLTVAITGTEATSEIALDAILTPTTNYSTAKTMTQLSGRLYMANLTAAALPDLQLMAMNIQINYTTDLVNVISNTNSHKDNLPPSFMPGEVYAFYLGVELNQGGWVTYHIPGRSPLSSDLTTIAPFGTAVKSYQVDDTSNKFGAATNMGYWHNENEIYPSDAVYSSGGFVRHHRFPTLTKLISQHYSANSTVGITTLPRLGINVSNVSISPTIQSKIKRWKIFYAKKETSNSTVGGSDLLHFSAVPSSDAAVRWSSGGNWTVQAEPGGSDNWDDFVSVPKDTIRGHSLDFLYSQQSNAPTYAWFHYKLRRTNVNTQYTGFRSLGGKLTVTGEDRGTNLSAVIDYTVPSSTTRSGSGFTKRLDNFAYTPPNALNGKFKTQYTEGTLTADIFSPGTSFDTITIGQVFTNSTGQDADANPWSTDVNGEDTMYMQYFKLFANVHISFTQQPLIPTEGYATPASTSLSNIAGGDTFLCYMSYLTAAPLNGNPDSTIGEPFKEGTRIWRGYIGYSRYNFNYRYQSPGDTSAYYHPKTDVRTLFTPYASTSEANHVINFTIDSGINKVDYTTDYNKLDEFVNTITWNPDLIQQTVFPNTIVYSPIQSEDSKEFSWRTFLAADKYTMPKNKGDIINIQGANNRELYINTKYSFFKTRTDAKQAVDGEEIFLKSANLFDLPPDEVVPTLNGYGGTQNMLGCVMTKYGYVWVDDLQGKVFMYDGQLKEISSNGERQFFRDFMGIKDDNNDNPYTQNGYTIGFDERVNRLIVTKKYNNLSWTISYNSDKQAWTSYHDYISDFYVTTANNLLWVIKDNKFYWANTPQINTVKGKYFTSDIYSSYIDVVHNEGEMRDKQFFEVMWLSELYPNTYVNGQPSLTLDYTSTCTHLTLRTQNHTTGRVQLINNNSFDSLYSSNIRNKNRTWSYNGIRDIAIQTGFTQGFYQNFNLDQTKLDTNMSVFEQRKFVDKFVICRYEYDNILNNRFLLLESNVDYRDAR